MNARLIQVVSRAIGVVLLTIAGFLFGDEVAGENAATIGQFGDAIAAAIVGFMTLVLDLFIHKLATGGVMKPAGGGS